MTVNQWVLETKGDPLGTVNSFLREVWRMAGLRGMILPSTKKDELKVVEEVSNLDEINPFQPLMLMNIAGLVPDILEIHPEGKFGILVRPCELRALKQVEKRVQIDINRLVTICVDCLGTYPDEEFGWRSARKGSEAGLTREVLQFAPQGGIASYRFRAACQMCTAPGAKNGNINFGVLGLPVRQVMIVDGDSDLIDWQQITDRPTEPSLSEKRESLLAKIIERHTQTRDRVMNGLAQVLPENLDALLDQFDDCGNCQLCMNACPICQAKTPKRFDDGRYQNQEVMDWLVDCAGCGMCEQSCPKHLPLSIIFTHIKKNLEKSLIN